MLGRLDDLGSHGVVDVRTDDPQPRVRYPAGPPATSAGSPPPTSRCTTLRADRSNSREVLDRPDQGQSLATHDAEPDSHMAG